MTTLLKNGKVINVFTGEIENKNVLISDKKIIGVGDYEEADVIEDVSGKYICPSFIDGHIHIESTMLVPRELSKVCLAHGTGAIVADPHEIANVCGVVGLAYMMESSEDLPLRVYFMLPSCVPATSFDESGAILRARDLAPFYDHKRVLGLAEMMNYPGVVFGDASVAEKLADAKEKHAVINGHAPMLTGKDLDKYISSGITDDHECVSFDEAVEKIRKGQLIMIREGTSARNLESLIDLFDEPYSHRCMLVTDDKHPLDLLENGHIDSIIRKAVKLGKSAVTGIKMATIQAAQYYGLKNIGAVAPGYFANLLVLNDLDTVDVRDVYCGGIRVCENKKVMPIYKPDIDPIIAKPVYRSFYIKDLVPSDFAVENKGGVCRAIEIQKGELITKEYLFTPDFSKNGGIDAEKDIVKLAVCERHMATGNIGLGFIKGLGIKEGAIASSVSHDSHNLIIAGASDFDMALAGNTLKEMNGGLCVVKGGEVIAKMPLPIAGLMSEKDARTAATENETVREAVKFLGVADGIEPFMNLAFVSLPVIPDIKMTTRGLVDVNKQELISLFV